MEARDKKRNAELQSSPVIVGLAAHVRKRWDSAVIAKRPVEEKLLKALRQRNGEYDPEKLADIRDQGGGSTIFIQLTSVKCRAATSWLRDTLMGTGMDKPWSIEATPEPTLPPEVVQDLQAQMSQQIMQHVAQGGQMPDEAVLRKIAEQMKDETAQTRKEEADARVARMEDKMADQLAEGGWDKALDEFLEDVVTYQFGVIKGPIKRRRSTLKWANGKLEPTKIIRNEWERVDPFMIYWAPWAWNLNDGFVIERHRMTAFDLQALVGVPGYNDSAIRTVLTDHRSGKINEWLWVDSAKATAEGKTAGFTSVTGSEDLIDALQLWDDVPGKLLLEWGLSKDIIDDPTKVYPCEVWLIGNVVIRAVLNYDPLGRKPYYLTSYEKRPGSVDGKGVGDLCRDSQNMVNATARALANNMAISSGPQIGVNISRLPAGEDITEMHPWKIWQFQSAEFNDGTPPLQFFSPPSNAQELMAVFEKFSARADEDTMVPKYMTGEHTPGAGRTSSGLSMLISNAGKGIKQVIKNIDHNVISPVIERLYQDNLRYSNDPDLIGDVNIVAKGANSLVVKEAEAVRRNEFMNIVLNNPLAQQIVGMDGAAELLRSAAKNLSGNTDRIVPSRQQLTTIEQQQQQIAQLQQQLSMVMGAPGGPQGGPPPQSQTPPMLQSKNMLPDGSQVGGAESNAMRPANLGSA